MANGIQAMYLCVDALLADPEGCGPMCRWLGLFHVDVPISSLTAVLADPAGQLKQPLLDALTTAEAKGCDAVRVGAVRTMVNDLSKLRLQMWSSSDTGQIDVCDPGYSETTCYLVAVENDPIIAGPIWCKPDIALE